MQRITILLTLTLLNLNLLIDLMDSNEKALTLRSMMKTLHDGRDEEDGYLVRTCDNNQSTFIKMSHILVLKQALKNKTPQWPATG